MSGPYQFLPPLSDDAIECERAWILQHGVSNLRSLTTALYSQRGLEFCAVNRAAHGSGINTIQRGAWLFAHVRPATASGFWWIAVVETGNQMMSTSLVATPAEAVVPLLERFGVTETRFRVALVEPTDLNPWDVADGGQSAPDTRTVYFVRAGESGLIKIGVAGDARSRLKSLQTGSPVPLTLLATIPGVGQSAESELHARFAGARSHGEWFRPVPELLAYIAENGVKS